jgi:hypothetical protein
VGSGIVPEPILVKRYIGDQSAILRCDCGHEWVETDADNLCCDWHVCPACGSTEAQFKYIEADPCKNCGTLGFHEEALGYCCSRVCMLQAEYAKSLDG